MPIFKASISLGIWDRPWRHVKYPDYPAIGRFEGDFFKPEVWRPEYPNPAFERMLPADAFWAVRIINRFSDDMIRAIGLDTPSIDHGPSVDFRSHVALFEHNVPAFESVARLERLPARGFTVIALPVKIGGGSGGPLRIVALLDP